MQYHHESRDINQQATQLKQPTFYLNTINDEKIHSAIVHILFNKGADPQSGNGFFLNIPGAKYNLILTAGHNLLSNKEHTKLKIRLFNQENCITIPNENIRVSSEWKEYPETDAAYQHDYGAILLPDNIQVPGDFGFSLPLSMENRMDCTLSVTGYRDGDLSSGQPVTDTGKCLRNRVMGRDQLEYDIKTAAGLSGSPVWVGLNGHPTVVAIHTYGQPTNNRRSHCRNGRRLNLKCLSDIFTWSGVNMTTGILRACQSGKLLEPPLRLACSPHDNIFRVVVDEIDDPPETMLVNIFPVYTAPSSESVKPGFGFMQINAMNQQRWVSWNVQTHTASLVNDIRKANLARLEGKDWKNRKNFMIVTRLAEKDHMVTIEYGSVGERWQWEEEGEVLDAIKYRRYIAGGPNKELFFTDWTLESYSMKTY